MSRFNYQNQHLSGTQRYMADKYYNDIKKQQENKEVKKTPISSKESEHSEDMQPIKLLRLIKKFYTDNPGKELIYDSSAKDYLNQKKALDYWQEHQFLNIIPISEGFIKIELTEKGREYEEV